MLFSLDSQSKPQSYLHLSLFWLRLGERDENGKKIWLARETTNTEERRVKGICTAESRVGRGYRFAAAC